MKEKLLKVGKTAAEVTGLIVGLAMSGFCLKQLLPSKQYSKSELPAPKSPEKEEN